MARHVLAISQPSCRWQVRVDTECVNAASSRLDTTVEWLTAEFFPRQIVFRFARFDAAIGCDPEVFLLPPSASVRGPHDPRCSGFGKTMRYDATWNGRRKVVLRLRNEE